MVTMGVFPFQRKTHMVEPGIEPGTSWLVVRSSDHQATRLVTFPFVHSRIYIPQIAFKSDVLVIRGALFIKTKIIITT